MFRSREVETLKLLREADANTISCLQQENARLWEILNRNANKPQRRDKKGRWAAPVVSEF